MGIGVSDDARFGFPGTSGVPHPGAAMTPPLCDSDLYLLGFTGVNYCCAWGKGGKEPCPAPRAWREILRVWRPGRLGGTSSSNATISML